MAVSIRGTGQTLPKASRRHCGARRERPKP
ncbi:hypothetical protein F383_34773 [Gossypium arboreum]|uniref:Uncharacterized protein n=1 Tax=Gossypium arboreum TaxID=29729 RepID=A0A0B0N1B3_GOSAR|nr:hypothetical protein F383_34773 [Gossypium arboreum]